MVYRLEEILENVDLEEYTYQEDYDVTAIRGNTVKPERGMTLARHQKTENYLPPLYKFLKVAVFRQQKQNTQEDYDNRLPRI